MRRALLVGAAGGVLCLIGALVNAESFYRGYLLGCMLWLGVALGSLAILMLHLLVGGGWGFLIRRILEAATRTLPLMAVLFIPFVFGTPALYRWARPEAVQADPELQRKAPYLNTPF